MPLFTSECPGRGNPAHHVQDGRFRPTVVAAYQRVVFRITDSWLTFGRWLVTDPYVVITDTGRLDPGPAVELLTSEGCGVRVLGTTDSERIAAEAADATALVVHDAEIDAGLLERLPRLRLVVTMAADACNVDLPAAERRGLWIARVPQQVAVDQVAHHALALALAQLRRAAAALPGHLPGARRPCDLTLGLYGLDPVARRLAQLAAPLFARVVGGDLAGGSWPPGVEALAPREVLAVSDVVSLHLPLTAETAGVIDAAAIAGMRDGAVLVNTGSHLLADRADLLTALHSGKLAGVATGPIPALEPHAREKCPLRSHPAVLISPHRPASPAPHTADLLVRVARNVTSWRDRGIPLDPVARPGAGHSPQELALSG
ncbi:phosphoglycerate dehydrogenase [Marinitenerispora sediminis]|uniref:Phosphoglycerate dehydrogenase n=1 Tax=Marinitenerispora sediminis TaxID=1931232 RepID=A0A368SYK0_9ACTN|nr:phosphoglycerate dehydrogenase [Marinitenerispora sediminis]RCV52200.1 phosphoglycerate dehydrogenase [Marinitenerispora sediminis]